MNSTASKRYLKGRKPQENVNTDHVVFDISNGTSIFAGDHSQAHAVANGYNHQYCLPNKPLKYFVMNFIAVFDSIKQNNGASYNLHTRTLNLESGYMVTIPGFERIIDIPETLNKFQDEVTSYCINAEMWDKISTNPDNIYVGFWLHDGKLYIDLTENIADRDDAILAGNERNQIAIYDCYERHDIRIRIC